MTKTRDLADLGGGFIQAGSGVQRSVESKLQDVVSVLDFIPQDEHAEIKNGTSTYNCASGLQSALNTGRNVFLPNGTYSVASSLNVPGGASIVGETQLGCTINFTDSTADGIVITNLGSSIKTLTVTGGKNGIQLGDIAGSPSGATGAAREVLLEKVLVLNSTNIGINIDKGWSCYLKECKIYNPGTNAIRFGDGFINSIKIEGLRVTDIGSPYTVLLDAQTLRSVEFDHCIFEGNSNANSVAFYTSKSSIAGLSVSNCYFETHSGYWVDFSSCGVQVYGVTFDKCSFVGSIPAFNSPKSLSILNSTFTGSPTPGFIDSPEQCFIQGCAARTTGGSWSTQALITGTPSNCFISNDNDDLPDTLQTNIGNLKANNATITQLLVSPDQSLLTPVLSAQTTKYVPDNTTTTIASTSQTSYAYLVVGTRGASGSAIFLCHRGSSTVTSLGAAGGISYSLAWSGNDLQVTTASSGATFYVIRFI